VVASSPARIAVVRLQWAIAWDTFEERLRGFPAFTTIAQRGGSAGTAQWCVVHNTAGQGNVTWILSAATSAFEYQAAGTRRDQYPPDQTLSLVGEEAVQFPIPTPGPFLNYRDSWARYAPAGQRASVASVPRIILPQSTQPDFGACAYDVSASGGGATERVRGSFASGITGGNAGYSLTYTYGDLTSATRFATETQALWTVEYLTCESGGADQRTLAEPGCSNCGDRATLERWA
jgi:hypothetical protein